jgi:hypothetical protein
MASMSSIGSERGDTQILAGFSGRDVHVEIPPLDYRHGLSNHLGQLQGWTATAKFY